MKEGIKETRELIKFIVELAEGMAEASRGKWTLQDMFYFWGAVRALPAAVTGAGEIPRELRDLTTKEAVELVNYVATELELPPEHKKTERIVEKALAVVPPLVSLISEFTGNDGAGREAG